MLCWCRDEVQATSRQPQDDIVQVLDEDEPRLAAATMAEETPLRPSPVAPSGIRASTFKAFLRRATTTASWGMKLDYADDRRIHVCEVRDGYGSPVKVWNVRARGDRKIRDGDYITSVNGVSAESVAARQQEELAEAACSKPRASTAELLREAMKAIKVELRVARPTIFECRIHKDTTDSLGLDLNYSHKSNSLVVLGLSQGPVTRCAPEVAVGDRIVAVDGHEGDPEELLRALRASVASVLLLLSRPSTDACGM